MDFYRRIIPAAPVYLKRNGLLILEVGFNQLKALEEIIKIDANFSIREVAKDYNNIERTIMAKKGLFKNG